MKGLKIIIGMCILLIIGCSDKTILPDDVIELGNTLFKISENKTCFLIDKDNVTIYLSAIQGCSSDFGFRKQNNGELVPRCGIYCNPTLAPIYLNKTLGIEPNSTVEIYTQNITYYTYTS